MTNTYRAVSEYGKAIYGEEVFEGDFTVDEERDHLNGKHLELVPRKYTVLSDNYEAGESGATVDLALLKENEAALIQGGHLRRVEPKEAPAETKTASKPKKED